MYANALKPWHLLIVALVVIVLFGSKKLPDAARGWAAPCASSRARRGR